MPKISVVIPLYNKAPYIKRALDSVLAQTEHDFEVIVIDDGSTDGGGDAVKACTDPRIRYIRQRNTGVSGARNNGVKAAKARLAAFLDADDLWLPGFLATILSLQERFPGAGLYATAYSTRETSGKTLKPVFRAIPAPPWEGVIPDYFESVLGPPPVWTSAAAVPAGVFAETGGFDDREIQGEDQHMWLKIALKHSIAFSNTVMAVYCRDARNRTCDSASCAPEYGAIKTITRDLQHNNNLSPRQKECLREYANKFMLSSAAKMIASGETRSARKLLGSCKTAYYLKYKLLFYFWACTPGWLMRRAIGAKKILKKLVAPIRN